MNAERFGNRPAPNTFCIVIPAYNAEAYLAQTLQPILSSTEVDRILVVDDGSSDRTSECAKDLGVSCLPKGLMDFMTRMMSFLSLSQQRCIVS